MPTPMFAPGAERPQWVDDAFVTLRTTQGWKLLGGGGGGGASNSDVAAFVTTPGPTKTAVDSAASAAATVAANAAAAAAVAGTARLDAARDIPFPLGLVAFWDFTESAAPYVSKLGAGPYALTPAGTGTPPAKDLTDTGSPFGAPVSFTGTSGAAWLQLAKEQVGALNVAKTNGDEVTVVAWFKRRATATTAGFMGGMWQEDNADPRRQYGLFNDLNTYGGNDRVCMHVSYTGTSSPNIPFSRDYSTSKRAMLDRWVMVAGTYDGIQIKSYLDALADSIPTFTETGAPNGEGKTYAKNPYLFDLGLNRTLPADFTVGACKLTSGPGNYLDGLMGGLAVFNRCLTQAELMKLNIATAGTRPVVLFDFARDRTSATSSQLPAIVGWDAYKGATATTPGLGAGFTSVIVSPGPPFLSLSSSGSFTDNATTINFAQYADLAGLRLSQIGRITALLNHSSVDVPLRLCLRLAGGQWYASETDLKMTGTTPGVGGGDWSLAQTVTLVVNRAGAGWRKLTVTPGTTLALDAAAETNPLPNAEVTGIGVLCPNGTVISGANLRVRNIALYGAVA